MLNIGSAEGFKSDSDIHFRFAGCLRSGMEVSLAKREDESSYPSGYFQPHCDLPPATEGAVSLRQHLQAHHERLQTHPTLYAKNEDHKQTLYASDYARNLNSGSRHLSPLHYDSIGRFSQGALRHGRYKHDDHNRLESKYPVNRQHTTSSHGSRHCPTDNRIMMNSIYPIDNHNLISQQCCDFSYTTGSSSNNFMPNISNPFVSSHNLMLSSSHSQNPPADDSILSRCTSSSSNAEGQSLFPSWQGQKISSAGSVKCSLVSGRHRLNGIEHCTTAHNSGETPSKYIEPFQSDFQDSSEGQTCAHFQSLTPSSANLKRTEELNIMHQDTREDSIFKPAKISKEGQFRLHYQDFVEIKNLKESYHVTYNFSSLPLGDRMIKTDEMSKLYSIFVQRRAKFFVNSPLYKTLAASDRPKLLHIAVAMSAFFTGAHLIDTRDYTWSDRLGMVEKPITPIMSASTLRHFLTHEQFVYLMRFYTTYSPVFSDQTIAILMQMLSLFYPQPGLKEPDIVEQGRLYYGSLLSRYLLAVHGPDEGPEMLKMLIVSQQEARYLVDLLQHVELTPNIPRQDLVNSKKLLLDGLQMVCQEAKVNLARVIKEKKERCQVDATGSFAGSCLLPISKDSNTNHGKPFSPTKDSERLEFIEKSLIRLANCEDPKTLAEARQILPTDLIRNIFQQV